MPLRSVAVVTCVGCLLSWSRSAEAMGREPPAHARSKREAVLVGSSSINGALGRIIAADLDRRGYHVRRKGVASAGLARPDYRDMRRVMDELPIDGATAVVFVYLGMNDGQAIWLRPNEREGSERWLHWNDRRWSEVYLRRTRELYASLCRRGARRAIVLLPVDVAAPRLERRMERIRALQRQAAQGLSCASVLSTSGDKGRFHVGGVATRLSDGVHMTHWGAQLLWQRIKQGAWRLVEPTGPAEVNARVEGALIPRRTHPHGDRRQNPRVRF